MEKEADYILGIDVGNTNMVIGLFPRTQDFSISHHWRLMTRENYTADELGISIQSLLAAKGLEARQIKALIYSSVVPRLNSVIVETTQSYLGQANPLAVHCDMGLPLIFDYPRKEEIGADRLVNACAASVIYGGDLIIVDMGTATTFCVIHDGNKYLGGCIAPGAQLSMESLGKGTAQLPLATFDSPSSGIIGRSTTEALQAGFFFGWSGILREIIKCIGQANKERSYKVIATGGLAPTLQKAFPELFDEVDLLLTLRGLKCIMNRIQF